MHKACPVKITKRLADNGKEFMDCFFASREPSGNHEFKVLCEQLNIGRRLTQPKMPKTNGMVERFKGRIADVLKTHYFDSAEDLGQTPLRYVAWYRATSDRSQRWEANRLWKSGIRRIQTCSTNSQMIVRESTMKKYVYCYLGCESEAYFLSFLYCAAADFSKQESGMQKMLYLRAKKCGQRPSKIGG